MYGQSVDSTNHKPQWKTFLTDEPVQLREVVITAPDIVMKNDTLVYNVQKYTDAQDRTIADVLKKMPGIEVAENGRIKYNGVPINKFYIEGNDLLEGRYGLATNNISHSDVQNVEIMENHQPIRALQGIDYSEQAGLNLRLKESARLRWCGTANGGTGFSPALYDASLFAMRIAGKLQNMETVRFNNTGWNPASQNTLYTSDNLFGTAFQYNQAPDHISVGEHSTPLDDRRTRFNNSYLFNTTHSLKLNKVYDLKANVTYARDKLHSGQFAHTDYLDSSIAPLTETESLDMDTHNVSGQVILQSNQSGAYLKNKLSADMGWNDAVSNITGLPATGQKAKMPVCNIANELQIVKRIQNQILTISSSNSVVNKPHSLSVETGEKRYDQDVTASAFQSVSEASYSRVFGQWQIRGRAGLNYIHNKLESNLNGMYSDDFPVMNHSQLSRLNLYIRPEIIYENKRLRLNPYALMNQYVYAFNDRMAGERTTKNYGIIVPALSVRYKFSARLELFTNVKYAVVPPQPDIYYRGLIMNNYRYLDMGYPLYDLDRERSVVLSLRYRNPVSSFFANAGCVYEKNSSSLIHDQIFINDRIIMAYHPLSNNSDIFRVNGGISKGIFSGKIYAGIDIGYSRLTTVTMRNSAIVPYSLNTISVMPKVKGTLRRWMTVEYMLSVAGNTMDFKNNSSAGSYANLKQKLNISLFPVKKLQTYLGVEHYYVRFNDHTSDNLLLLDAGARWSVSGKVDIGLSATNLADDHYYRYSRFETLSETVYQYRIRPRNIVLSGQIRF